MNSYFIEYSPERELASLPREYTIEHALSNNDIVYDLNMTYNTDGFYNFLVNVNHGIPDKVRITYCESEVPAAVSILHYDGNIIRLVTDASRLGGHEYYDAFGYQIVSQTKNAQGRVMEEYILVTDDNKHARIFHIFL